MSTMLKTRPRARGDLAVTDAPKATRTVDADKITEQMDELLTDIDQVLEANSKEYVEQFVQKGGE